MSTQTFIVNLLCTRTFRYSYNMFTCYSRTNTINQFNLVASFDVCTKIIKIFRARAFTKNRLDSRRAIVRAPPPVSQHARTLNKFRVRLTAIKPRMTNNY